jgi:enamine deaminase RidA (YjgF/YER057c/UK114 family)
MERQRFPAGTRWDSVVGYSRAVRVGQFVFVSGTTGLDASGNVVGQSDPHAQTAQALANVAAALAALGASPTDVVRTRMYVTNIHDWEVEVSRLISPELLVEIEADAVIGGA